MNAPDRRNSPKPKPAKKPAANKVEFVKKGPVLSGRPSDPGEYEPNYYGDHGDRGDSA